MSWAIIFSVTLSLKDLESLGDDAIKVRGGSAVTFSALEPTQTPLLKCWLFCLDGACLYYARGYTIKQCLLAWRKGFVMASVANRGLAKHGICFRDPSEAQKILLTSAETTISHDTRE